MIGPAVLAVLGSWAAFAHEPPPDGKDVWEASAPPVSLPAWFQVQGAVNVRRQPDPTARRRGQLLDGAIVESDRWAVGPGCPEGWLGLGERGWICGAFAVPSEEPPPEQHQLIAFDPPLPSERAVYRRTGDYEREPEAEGLLPYVYARRIGRFPGWIHPDLDSAVAGAETSEQLEPGRAHHFRAVVETEAGAMLVLPGGGVVRMDEVSLYAPSRFGGEVIDTELPAWVRRGGGRVRGGPSLLSPILAEIEARDVVWLSGDEAGPPGRMWLRVVRPTEGWIAAWRLHRVRLLPELEEAGDQDWLDLDLDQQVLSLRDRAGASYATLVSTGVGTPERTPQGLYRIGDKLLHWDMASRPENEDQYHVEEVPFVMHFWPRFALHTAFWHDGFGSPRSHGCVNLAPKDARVLSGATSPALPPGWHSVFESPDEPGTLLRIHRGSPAVPDQRDPLR